jgi:hypothetical protein
MARRNGGAVLWLCGQVTTQKIDEQKKISYGYTTTDPINPTFDITVIIFKL